MESWQNRINSCKEEITTILKKYHCELIEDEQYGVLIRDQISKKDFTDLLSYDKQVEELKSFIDANFGKKIESHKIENDILILKFYGRLDDCQIEKLQDNFDWIAGLEFDHDGEAGFSLDL